jgi:Flp pilus assembly protein TadD
LRPLAEDRPDDPEVGLLYGRALLRSGRSSGAVWPLRKAAEDPTYEFEAGLLLATALREGGNQPDAVAAVDRVLARYPDDHRALDLRARIHLSARSEDAALADIDRVLEAEPQRLSAHVIRAVALIELERLDEAEETLARATALAESEKDPSSPSVIRLCAMRAVFARERGEKDEARAQFEACLAVHPSRPLVVSEYIEFLEAEGEYERAREVLEEAIQQAPERVDFRIAQATRLRAIGRIDEAEQLLLDIEAPPFAKWTAVGDHYVALQDWDRAHAAFALALENLKSPPPMLVFGYCDALIQAGQLAKARKLAETLEPPMSDLLRGRIAFEEGAFGSALQSLEAGLRLWPDNPTGHLLAAQAAERLGDFDLALVHYRESVRAGPEHTRAALELAALFEALGDFEAGLEPLRLYVAAFPADPEAYVLVARLAAQVGRTEVSDQAFTRLAALPGQSTRVVSEGVALMLEYGEPDAAAQLADESGIDLSEPENAEALAAYVEALVAAGRAEDALARTEAALERHPDELALKAIRARALAADGRSTSEVRAALAEAPDQEATYPEASLALAALLTADGEVDEALGLYDLVYAARPGDPDAAFAAAELLLAKGQSVRAERRLEALLVAHPRHAGAALRLARLLAERPDELERAQSLAVRAVRFHGGLDAVDALGRILFARGDHAAAILAFKGVLEQRPEAASTRYALARALSADGQLEAARAAYREALSFASFPERTRAERELAALDEGSESAPVE